MFYIRVCRQGMCVIPGTDCRVHLLRLPATGKAHPRPGKPGRYAPSIADIYIGHTSLIIKNRSP